MPRQLQLYGLFDRDGNLIRELRRTKEAAKKMQTRLRGRQELVPLPDYTTPYCEGCLRSRDRCVCNDPGR